METYSVSVEHKLEPYVHIVDSVETGKILVAKVYITQALDELKYHEEELGDLLTLAELLKEEKYVEAYDLFFSGIHVELSYYCDIDKQKVITKKDLI